MPFSMDLLAQLGVDSSLGIQLLLFLIVFAILKYLLFTPYYAAYVERRERTLGKTELAERFVSEARELEAQYGIRAQEANDRFRTVYDSARTEAVKEYDRLVSQARAKSRTMIEESRQGIEKQMTAARTQLGQEVAGVSQLINRKLIGKDLEV
jgi:F0F1-type ATP synthase membrane subunit b/b'